MNVIEAIILGIIQGLTEFLPVSSSGHLELGKALFGGVNDGGLLFSVILHAATALSTVVVFRQDIWDIIKGVLKFEWNEETQFAAKIVLSMIPVGIVGLFFKDFVETFFDGKILFVGFMLLLTGTLLLLTHYFGNKQGSAVNFFQAFVIGVAQAIAVLPGISRSGATIATALLIGVDKSKAARFSFLMVIPPILGASLLELLEYLEAPAESALEVAPVVAGFVTAFLVGFAACTWMIGIVKKGKLSWFAYYCFVAGTIAIAVSW